MGDPTLATVSSDLGAIGVAVWYTVVEGQMRGISAKVWYDERPVG